MAKSVQRADSATNHQSRTPWGFDIGEARLLRHYGAIGLPAKKAQHRIKDRFLTRSRANP